MIIVLYLILCVIYISIFSLIFLGCIPSSFPYNYRVFIVVLKRFFIIKRIDKSNAMNKNCIHPLYFLIFLSWLLVTSSRLSMSEVLVSKHWFDHLSSIKAIQLDPSSMYSALVLSVPGVSEKGSSLIWKNSRKISMSL